MDNKTIDVGIPAPTEQKKEEPTVSLLQLLVDALKERKEEKKNKLVETMA